MLKQSAAGLEIVHRMPWDVHRLWSLWELMRLFNAGHCCFLFADMATWIQGFNNDQAPTLVPQDALELFVHKQFAIANLLAVYADLPESTAMIDRIRYDFIVDPRKPPQEWTFKEVKASVLTSNLHHLKEVMQSELEKKTLLLVPDGMGKYYIDPDKARETLFGPKVDRAFPNARADIIEAGNCLACGRNNGAAYHLLCVAEVGLRALAWDRRVVTKNKKDRKYPLEMAEWGTLIAGIETEVAKISSWRRTLLKAEAERFYNGALVELRAFNNGWRTHVMHGRAGKFHQGEALALWGHVLRFMQMLATRISANERTPMVWKTRS